MRFFPRRDAKRMKDSQQAILDATKSLREVREKDDEVHQVSGVLKNIRERNHFAEQLRSIMQGG